MDSSPDVAVPAPGRPGRAAVLGVVLALVLAAAALTWSKWVPYTERAVQVATSGTWSGSDVLTAGGVRPGDPPSWHAGRTFTLAYAGAVWKALVAALLIGAAVQALVPRTWLLRLLARRTRLGSAAVGGLAGTPSMMCTCCTAPVAVGLRRRGVPLAGAVAYWLGNPLLSPAVLVFLLLVAPWQWAVVRAVVGTLVVVGGAALVAALVERGRTPATRLPALEEPDAEYRLGPALRRFVCALLRSTLVLVPEYLVVVMLVGAFRGWLFPLGAGTALATGVLVGLAAVLGTLVVVPTGGEIPVLHGLALAGAATGVLGSLLVTLPAVSLPGMVMVGRALGWRATTATAGVVAVGGLLGAGLLVLLGA
jgi:uncharacterized membrane protein YraQ (UPF0718 family)